MIRPLLLATLLAAACTAPAARPSAPVAAASPAPGADPSPSGKRTPIRAEMEPTIDLARGSTSAITELRLACLRSEEPWRAFWTEHGANLLPPPAVPEVDWSRHQVVALVLGERNSGGYGVAIERVEAGDAGMAILARESRPKPGEPTTLALTSPFHFVAVDRDLPLGEGLVLRLVR